MRGKCSCGWEGIVNGKGQCMLCEHLDEDYKFERVAGMALIVLIAVFAALFFGYDALVYLALNIFGW